MEAFKKIHISGFVYAVVLSSLGLLLGRFYGLLGGITNALVIGIIARNIGLFSKKMEPGVTFSEKTVLSIAIICIGANLDFRSLAEFDGLTLGFIVLSATVAIGLAVALGSFFRISKSRRALIGAGTAICGSSAIAACAPMVSEEKSDIGIAVTTVNLIGILGVFILPFIGKSLAMNDFQSGLLVGSSLQAVGHVVAAGYSITETAGDYASVVKMARVALLVPLVLGLGLISGKGQGSKQGLPIYLVGFCVTAAINSTGLTPEPLLAAIRFIGKSSLAIAMTGIGLNIDLKKFLKQGPLFIIYGASISTFHVLFVVGAILAIT